MRNKLDFALHVLYFSVDTYPCHECDLKNACCIDKKEGCIIKDAFDVVHQEILRKEEPKNAED